MTVLETGRVCQISDFASSQDSKNIAMRDVHNVLADYCKIVLLTGFLYAYHLLDQRIRTGQSYAQILTKLHTFQDDFG